MMEQLTAPDQPFYGRATELVLDPLTPTDVGTMTGSGAFGAFDAYLITGGLPLVAQEWEAGTSAEEFLRSSFSSSTSALVVSVMSHSLYYRLIMRHEANLVAPLMLISPLMTVALGMSESPASSV